MQNHETDSIRNRKTNVCYRLLNWLYCLASVACAVLGPRVLHAHQAPDRALDAVRLEGTRPQIDGVLDDSVWQQAPIFTGFVQREPEEGQRLGRVRMGRQLGWQHPPQGLRQHSHPADFAV